MPKLHHYQVYTPSVSTEEDHVDRLESSITLNPGTYWRCVKTPESGSLVNRVSENEVLLLLDVFDDEKGNAHSVSMLLTPERRAKTTCESVNMMVSDFFDHFIHEPLGESIRKEQVSLATEKLNAIQDDIVSVQTNPSHLLTILMKSDDEDLQESKTSVEGYLKLSAPQAGSEIQAQSDALITQDQLKHKKEIASITGKVLTKISEKLNAQIGVIGLYHSEVGHLALARTKESRQLVDKVSRAIDSLDIYLGKNVEVYPVKAGVSGNSDEKYTLYQNMLFMDEESLIHAEIGDSADYTDIEFFFKQLKHDKSLIERIFPFNRCVVIMRPRRNDKFYDGASPFEQLQKSLRNKASFIMVRNGENIHAIFHPMDFMHKLYPSQSDLDDAFKMNSWADCRNITKDDLDYIRALNEDEKIRRHYKNVVLMLQGIIDRDEQGLVFGEMPVPGKVNLLNPVHQGMVFNFVSMDSAIQDETKPSYSDWFEGINKRLRLGSTIYITRNHINSKNVPGAFIDRDGYTHADWSLSDPDFFYKTHTVEKHGKKLGVKTEFHHDFDCSRKRNFIIEVEPSSKTVFDMTYIRASDIDYYLNSRKERIHYESYIDKLLNLKWFAEKEEEKTQAARDVLRQALIASGQSVNEDHLFAAVMRLKGDRDTLDLNDSDNAGLMHDILNIYWQLEGGASAINQKIIDHFGKVKPEDSVLCITQDEKNTSFVFTLNKENNKKEDRTGFPWLRKHKITNPDTLDYTEQALCRFSEIKGKLSITYEHERLSEIVEIQDSLHSLTYRQVKNWHKKINAAFNDDDTYRLMSIMDAITAGEGITDDSMSLLLEILEDQHTVLEEKSKNTKRISMPLNIVSLGILGSSTHKHYAITAQFNTVTILSLAMSAMNDQQKAHWIEVIRAFFVSVIGNKKQFDYVMDNEGKSVESLLPLYHIKSDLDHLGGLFCSVQDNCNSFKREGLMFSPLRYHGYIKADDAGEVHYSELFSSRYPALASKITRKFDFEVQGRNDRVNKIISIKDLPSEIAREKERIKMITGNQNEH